MNPVLIDAEVLGVAISLGAYATFMVSAWIAGVAVGTYMAHRLGLRWRRVLALFALSLAAGIVLARVFDLFIAWGYYSQDISRIWELGFGGFSLYGGLLGAGLTGLALAHRWGVPVWRLADSTFPGIAVAVVLMRTGCFLNGCCYGHTTDLPWGVTYPVGSPVWVYQLGGGSVLDALSGTVVPVHPTPLYEMLAAGLLGIVGLAIVRRRLPDGVAFLTFATGFTLFRMLNGFLRVRQPVVTAPEWFYPVFYLALAGVFSWLLVRRLRSHPSTIDAAAPVDPAPSVPPPLPLSSTHGTGDHRD